VKAVPAPLSEDSEIPGFRVAAATAGLPGMTSELLADLENTALE
jgi:hypothetical protein